MSEEEENNTQQPPKQQPKAPVREQPSQPDEQGKPEE